MTPIDFGVTRSKVKVIRVIRHFLLKVTVHIRRNMQCQQNFKAYTSSSTKEIHLKYKKNGKVYASDSKKSVSLQEGIFASYFVLNVKIKRVLKLLMSKLLFDIVRNTVNIKNSLKNLLFVVYVVYFNYRQYWLIWKKGLLAR